TGAAYVVLGSATPQSATGGGPGAGAVTITGDATTGEHVAAVGDVDGDGFDDVAVLAQSAASMRPAHIDVVFGSGSPEDVDLTVGIGTLVKRITGPGMTDLGGSEKRALASPGDINGDGRDDLLVAQKAGPRHDDAVVHAIYGSGSRATIDLAALGEGEAFTITGVRAQAGGAGVSGAGDVNAGGRADLLIGSPSERDASGAAYVLYGAQARYPTITGRVGRPLSVTPALQSLGAATLGIAPALPDGLTFDPATGTISGTPLEAADATRTVTIADDRGVAESPVRLAIGGSDWTPPAEAAPPAADAPPAAPAPEGEPRAPAALRVGGVRIAGGRLHAAARGEPRATGALAATFRARGRTVRFDVAIPPSGDIRIDRRLPAGLRRACSGTLQLGYAGDDRVLPAGARLRAAAGAAELSRPVVRAEGAAFTVRGSISRRAAGRGRIRVEYADAHGEVRTATGVARIRHGRWSLSMARPGDAAPGASLSVTARYAGSRARDLAGAQTVAAVRL
ncbi:MAG: putative Ig domain-containing protein, partial [Solirubrobacteraceae bacterium]|nr:putative Ig domain-containing protein [Solirubrobacteraceae bacterium]